MPFMLKLKITIVFLAIIYLLNGCASYQVGSGALPFTSLYVEPARNDTYAPQAQALLTEQVIQALLRDGRVRITAREEADAVLSMTLVDYDRNLVATQSNDTARARGYDLSLTAQLDLKNASTGKAYFEGRQLSVTASAYTDGGLQPAEYQSMPTLTRRLAEQIRTEILSTW